MKLFLVFSLTTISMFACGVNYKEITIMELISSLSMFYIPLLVLNLTVDVKEFNKKYFYITILEILFIFIVYLLIGLTLGFLPEYLFILIALFSFLPSLFIFKKVYLYKVIAFISIYWLYSALTIFSMNSPNYRLPADSKVLYQKIIYGDTIKYSDGSPFHNHLDKNNTLKEDIKKDVSL